MRLALLIAMLAVSAAQPQDKVNPGAQALQDFSQRVADYVKLHKTVRSQIHGLKPTSSAGKIAEYQERFGHHIREARRGAAQGNIFTPEIAAEFRRLIGITMQGPEGTRIRASLQHAAPVRLKYLRVNHQYPEGLALQSTPPSLLLNLPLLPPEVEYRVVGRSLILRDIDADLIVDFIPGAIN